MVIRTIRCNGLVWINCAADGVTWPAGLNEIMLSSGAHKIGGFSYPAEELLLAGSPGKNVLPEFDIQRTVHRDIFL